MDIPYAQIGLGGMGIVLWGLVLVGFLAHFALIAERRFALLGLGEGKDDRFHDLGQRIVALVRDGILQGRMPRKRYAATGRSHVLVFWGFMVLAARSITMIAQGFVADFHLPLLSPDGFIGQAYLAVKDLFILLVLWGILVMFINRTITKPWRLTLSGEAVVILLLIATLMVTDLFVDGATHKLTGAEFHWYGFNGWFMAHVMPSDPETLHGIIGVNWWIHVVVLLAFLNLLPVSKHFHVITALFNVFFKATDPPGRLSRIDFEDETLETYGRNKLTDFSWKNVLDWYTCTECGRCSDNCPATNTSKPLSPKHLTVAMRDHLYAHGDKAVATQRKSGGVPDDDPLNAPVIPDVLRAGRSPLAEKLDPDAKWDPAEIVWSCTTCRACEVQCPVHIEYVDLIVDLRRYQVMMESRFPSELKETFKGMENNQNPWGIGYDKREDWAEGLDVPVLKEGEEAPEYLFFVGCAGAFDDRNKKVSQALTKIMKRANVEFATLGCRECCTGDSARRAGNEYLFDMLAQQNVEKFKEHKVKKVVTSCPHCFNMLKNEYTDYGVDLDVVHHSQLIAELVDSERITFKPEAGPAPTIAYHDSCYLGRYNEVYEAPRLALEASGAKVKEAALSGRDGLCCGAGGARMWMEEDIDQRVNLKRFDQLRATGAEEIGVACPFCMTMMDDAMKHEEMENEMRVSDISEIVAEKMA